MLFSFPVQSLEKLNAAYNCNYNFEVTAVSSSSNPQDNTLLFCKRVREDTFATAADLKNCIVIVPERQVSLVDSLRVKNFVIGVKNPRLEYARIYQYILQCMSTDNQVKSISSSAAIGKDVRIGKKTTIGQHVVIGDKVCIGDGCTLLPGTIINSNVRIGDNTLIRENAVIGGYGFGFERDEQGIPIRLPHVGGVIIGSNVEIGAHTTIASGTIEPTIIEDYVKIDDHVHVAHNCHIGKCCLITACAEISGSVKIGEYTWLGPNCSIINGIQIGKYCFVGIGAVVKKSVPDEIVVTGDPARSLEDIKLEKDLQKTLLMAYQKGKLKFVD